MAFPAPHAAVASAGCHPAAAVELAPGFARSIARALGGARLSAAGLALPAAGRHGAGSTSGAEPEGGPLDDTAPVTLALERSPPLDVGVGHDRRSFVLTTVKERACPPIFRRKTTAGAPGETPQPNFDHRCRRNIWGQIAYSP